jgi:hypothetical protein
MAVMRFVVEPFRRIVARIDVAERAWIDWLGSRRLR